MTWWRSPRTWARWNRRAPRFRLSLLVDHLRERRLGLDVQNPADLPEAEEENQREEGEDELVQNLALRFGRLLGRGGGDPGHRALHAHRYPVRQSPVCGLRCHTGFAARS